MTGPAINAAGLAVGDAVSKITGYPFDGIILALYDDGKPKAVVRHRDGWQHIFAVSQLARQGPEPVGGVTEDALYQVLALAGYGMMSSVTVREITRALNARLTPATDALAAVREERDKLRQALLGIAGNYDDWDPNLAERLRNEAFAALGQAK